MPVKKKGKLKVALLCGGPSLERGISLNSARTVLDHLAGDDIEIIPIYFDQKKQPYLISPGQLYSSTPSDFDFKLDTTAKKLDKKNFEKTLRSVDLAFPAMHGAFGEDGSIQKILEDLGVPYVGLDSVSAKKCFHKMTTHKELKKLGFATLPTLLVKVSDKNAKKEIDAFFKENNLKRVIVKPATGGSSIGVFSVSNSGEALDKVKQIFREKIDKDVVIEPFCMGKEFTVIVLESKTGKPTAFIPTEIETDYSNHQIFDFRKKYLPTNQVLYHCPPRFSDKIIDQIQEEAQEIFKQFEMKDFARFDGWVFPDGSVLFSDLNPISGMDQNSFLFQQSARVGLSHRDLLRYIVGNVAHKANIPFSIPIKKSANKRKRVNVLFGGDTSERQVSIMSGTNVWLKLYKSKKYEPKPYLLDFDKNVWELPYAYALNHTVEEIVSVCKETKNSARLLELRKKVLKNLSLNERDLTENFFMPRKMSFADFIKGSKFVFLGLHGGDGESGVIQAKLDKAKVKYNGSGPKSCALCMDKFATGEKLKGLEKFGIYSAPKKIIYLDKKSDTKNLWNDLTAQLKAKSLIVKPQDDGCSSGIVRLFSASDLQKYINITKKGNLRISPNTFKNQTNIIEMPIIKMKAIVLEPFIETDEISVRGNKLTYKKKTGWIEVTVGVVETKKGLYALNPSITVAESSVLSVEEKFQGGTGLNITPPPQNIVSKLALKKIRRSTELVAKILGIKGYARIDSFVNGKTGEIMVIESNNLPGLTPSTVIYHQALAEKSSIFPTEFSEKIIENKGY